MVELIILVPMWVWYPLAAAFASLSMKWGTEAAVMLLNHRMYQRAMEEEKRTSK